MVTKTRLFVLIILNLRGITEKKIEKRNLICGKTCRRVDHSGDVVYELHL